MPNTEIISVTTGTTESEQQSLHRAANCIRAGGLVVFPTETVYGLGGNALDAEAARKIYAAKGRPSDNPLIIHIADVDWAEAYCHTTALFYRLATAFWPGPLTMILPKRDCIPSSVTGGLDTVAVRLPSDPIANALIRLSGVPIAAPSANLSGHPSPTTKEHVIGDLSERVDMILAGEPSEIGLESTVIKLDGDDVIILRPGGITYEDLCALLGEEHVRIDRIVTEKVTGEFKPLSPGMKYRHYAPNAAVVLLHGTEAQITSFLQSHRGDPDVGFLVYEEEYETLPASRTLHMGRRDDPAMQAHRLFSCLRQFDEIPRIKTVFARIPSREGIGLAVYNRLAKAAGFTVLDLSDTDAVSAIPTFSVLGLTGGSGAGKGAVAATLTAHGIPTLDTDRVSRLVCEVGQPCLRALAEQFGDGILCPDGSLDRAGLAALVFGESDPDKKAEKLAALNRITHHYILEYARDWLAEQRAAGCTAACIDAPQLFESGFDRECSYIIGVTADKETRIARIMTRDGITREKAEQRIASQHDDAFFAAHCNTIIENNGDLDALDAAVRQLLADGVFRR
ncbi:MAG: threonylcarbamoyl-AMP synthase [Ruminococcaceae bacterium]|nr:threonylcarbamoyl-AMP synthase [Oscillospiraceae bacterium]